jgi:hypothetical protein
MARRIDFEDDALVIRFTGLGAFVRQARTVRAPYASINSVTVGLGDPPGVLALKAGWSAPPFGTTQRGRFREHGRWSFLDVDDRERAVVLDLDGERFKRVALTVDDPEAMAAKVRERTGQRG